MKRFWKDREGSRKMDKREYRLGLVSVSFREHTPEEILAAMKNVGLSFVEWGSDVHAPCCDTNRISAIAETQTRYGIRCSSYGTYFRLGETPIEQLPEYIAAAKVLGTDILRLWCGSKSGANMTEEEKNRIFDQSRRAAEIAEKSGVTLCMECHRHTFTERPDDAIALMQTVDSTRFRMYWQPFQWLTAEENTQIAEQIAPYAAHIHVFNWKGDARFPLQDAVAEWQTYLRAFSTPRTLLLEFMPDDCLQTLPTEADALKRIAGGMI